MHVGTHFQWPSMPWEILLELEVLMRLHVNENDVVHRCQMPPMMGHPRWGVRIRAHLRSQEFIWPQPAARQVVRTKLGHVIPAESQPHGASAFPALHSLCKVCMMTYWLAVGPGDMRTGLRGWGGRVADLPIQSVRPAQVAVDMGYAVSLTHCVAQ